MKKIGIALFLTMIVIIALLYKQFYYQQSGTVVLEFDAIAAGNPLEYNQSIYPNPGGEGHFSVRAFQLYLSNIQLIGKQNQYHPKDSYYLARFDNDSRRYRITLKDVPFGEYSEVSLSIGVDEQANASLIPRGDLDPNSRMAWNWEVGYKFVLFEGNLSLPDSKQALVYHIGFSENLKTNNFKPSQNFTPGNTLLRFNVDVMALFKAKQIIDMNKLPSVKFERQDAKLLARNYKEMISLVD